MGIDDSVEYGNDCLECYPGGKAPESVKCALAGLQLCQWAIDDLFPILPPNGIYTLEQIAQCTWSYAEADYQITYFSGGPFSSLAVSTDIWAWFWHKIDGTCHTQFVNQLVCEPLIIPGFGGSAKITTGG